MRYLFYKGRYVKAAHKRYITGIALVLSFFSLSLWAFDLDAWRNWLSSWWLNLPSLTTRQKIGTGFAVGAPFAYQYYLKPKWQREQEEKAQQERNAQQGILQQAFDELYPSEKLERKVFRKNWKKDIEDATQKAFDMVRENLIEGIRNEGLVPKEKASLKELYDQYKTMPKKQLQEQVKEIQALLRWKGSEDAFYSKVVFVLSELNQLKNKKGEPDTASSLAEDLIEVVDFFHILVRWRLRIEVKEYSTVFKEIVLAVNIINSILKNENADQRVVDNLIRQKNKKIKQLELSFNRLRLKLST